MHFECQSLRRLINCHLDASEACVAEVIRLVTLGVALLNSFLRVCHCSQMPRPGFFSQVDMMFIKASDETRGVVKQRFLMVSFSVEEDVGHWKWQLLLRRAQLV